MPTDMIPIGKFSEVTRLSKKALYCYERKGLLVPVQKDICTGYRYYAQTQIETGIWITALTTLGFSQDEAAIIINSDDKNSQNMQKLIEKQLRNVRCNIRRLDMAERVLSSDNPFEEMFKLQLENWEIKEISPVRVMSIKGEGPYAEIVGPLIEQLCAEVYSPENQKNGIKCTGPVTAIYTSEECDETGGPVEVALPVAGTVALKNPSMEIRTLPDTRALTVIHKGSYFNLGMTHKKLYEYIQEHNLKCSGPARELYLNDPAETAEEDLIVEIQYPVE